MGLEFLGGIANAYKGYQQGADQELERQQLALDREQKALENRQRGEDRAYQLTQREYAAGQQARTLREQKRDDAMQDELRAIPLEREQVTPEVTGNNPSAYRAPTTTKAARYNDEMARDHAKVLMKNGKFGEAEKYLTYANKVGFERSTKQFNEVVASSTGKSGLEIVKSVAEVFKNDPYAGQIENIKEGADGSISIEAVNRETGQRQLKTFKNAEQVVNDLRAYYSPEMYAKLEDARRAQAAELAKESRKTTVLNAGGTLVDATGRVLAHNPRGEGGGGGGGRTGGGRGAAAGEGAALPNYSTGFPEKSYVDYAFKRIEEIEKGDPMNSVPARPLSNLEREKYVSDMVNTARQAHTSRAEASAQSGAIVGKLSSLLTQRDKAGYEKAYDALLGSGFGAIDMAKLGFKHPKYYTWNMAR